MRESQLSKTIKAEGEVIRARADVLEGLQVRLGDPVPEPIRVAVEGTTDLATLDRWFRAMLTAGSWAEFQELMKQE